MAETGETQDKLRRPLDVAVILAIAVPATACVAIVGAWVMHDNALASDLIKGFIGPSLLVIVNFYFGSSRSSGDKNQLIADLASNQAGPTDKQEQGK
jgi:hypothetical protein